MRRREFITLLSGAAAAWPLATRAQPPERMRRIGILLNMAEGDPETEIRLAAFRQGLLALGWKENINIRIDYRFAGGDSRRIQLLAEQLVSSAPELIVAHTTPAVAALKAETHAIPVVFAVVNDPVGQGLIVSLARPGGNITGFTYIDFEMVGKWLQMLAEVAPSIRRACLVFNSRTTPYYQNWTRELAMMPRRPASEIVAAPVRDQADLDPVITAIADDPGSGLIVAADIFNTTYRRLIISLAERHRLPAVYFTRFFVTDGGLISYGPDIADIFRRTGSYIDRILNGAKAADLPAQAPTKFELAINFKTAKALGLEVPPTLLARADEVIE